MADTNLLILAREFKNLRTHVQEVLKMPVGPQGLQGEKGEQGVKGDTGAPGKDGKDGKDGVNGLNGQDGRNGADGKDGKDGLDGVGVQNAYIDFDNSLVIVLTNGQEINAGFLSQEAKDAVVATFKQGAQTLNELLPVQTGNANKFLKTDGENVSWDTLDGSDINLASPPVIGNTTPNAATFTTLTATTATIQASGANSGLLMARNTNAPSNSTRIFLDSSGGASTIYTQGGNNISLATGATPGTTSGPEQARISHTASAVNYVQVTGAATGSAPVIGPQGSDANITLGIQSKGTGAIRFDAGGSANFRVLSNSSAVNRIDVTGSASGIAPSFAVSGSDTNISMALQSKGTGAIDLAAGSSGVNISNGTTVTAITRTAAGTGYTSVPSVAVTAPTTAGGVQATAIATLELAAVTPTVVNGGTGYSVNDVLVISGGAFTTAAQVVVSAVSGGVITAVTRGAIGVGYTSVPTSPVSVTGGTGTGATFNVSWGVTSAFTITNAGSGYVEQPTVTFSGGGGSGAAAYASVGSGTVIRSIGSAGLGSIDFNTPASATNGVPALRIRDVLSSTPANTGYFLLHNNNGYAQLTAQGPTDAQMAIGASGTGFIRFNTNGTSETNQMRVTHTASAVNYVQVTGAATGGRSVISAQGSDASTGLSFTSKGASRVAAFFNNNATSSFQFSIGLAGVTNAVNYLNVNGVAASSSPELTAEGTDTNLDIRLTPKGTGLVRFGTRTASADAAITGYIEIKDSGGTVRRLAVIG